MTKGSEPKVTDCDHLEDSVELSRLSVLKLRMISSNHSITHRNIKSSVSFDSEEYRRNNSFVS